VDRRAFRRCMHILESRHEPEDWSRGLTPFEILVSTVLSQSTNVANERRGMEGLRTAFGRITPQGLASQKTNDLARAIWHAGLSNRKASRIRALAGRIAARSDDRLRDILRRPTKEARDLLLTLPGVGLKTADVLLAMAADRPVFPVDTHVARIARRWRIVRPADGYEATRAGLERWTPFEKTRGMASRSDRPWAHPVQGGEPRMRTLRRLPRLRLVPGPRGKGRQKVKAVEPLGREESIRWPFLTTFS